MLHPSGQVKPGFKPECEKAAFLLFTEEILNAGLRYSNLYGKRLVAEWNHGHPSSPRSFLPIDEAEWNAFIALHCFTAAYKDHVTSTSHMWNEIHGRPIYTATMSEKRFKFIKRCFRVDDPRRRDREDKLAPVRTVFEDFVAKLKHFVHPFEFFSVDEQLLEYHGRVAFKQYIASKPGKFGMKLFWIVDSTGSYVYNGLPYIGAGTLSTEASGNFSEAVVLRLCQPLFGSGANITGDNYFTSSALVDKLAEKKLSYVGTVRSNRRDIPPAVKSTNGLKKGESTFLYSDGQLLCRYWDKGCKAVLLLDSFARDGQHQGRKPDTVLHYNSTKSGVDIVDKKVRTHSMKRKCRRWPYSFAMNLLDVAVINAMYIYLNSRALTAVQRKTFHYDFLIATGMQLAEAHIKRRFQTSVIGRQPRVDRALNIILPLLRQQTCTVVMPESSSAAGEAAVLALASQQRCHLCPRGADKKSKIACSSCRRAMCQDHRCSKCTGCH
jgi:hypothetical protein